MDIDGKAPQLLQLDTATKKLTGALILTVGAGFAHAPAHCTPVVYDELITSCPPASKHEPHTHDADSSSSASTSTAPLYLTIPWK